ncbi:transmembrane protein [methanogenic archaeon ISO4-H5]|nr:transmembrane protein [methanogenic archaeon ISO4-H5]
MDFSKRGILDILSNRWFCLFSAILPVVFLNLLIITKYGYSAEGWYIVYAELILDGKTPYVDFDLLFPPLYTYLITGIVAVFGNSLIVFRIFGLLVLVLTVIVVYYLFATFFTPQIATIATIISFFAVQLGNVYITYDYICIFELMNYLTFLILIRSTLTVMQGKEGTKASLGFFLAGITCSTGILLRQTTGLIIMACILLMLLIFSLLIKEIGVRLSHLVKFLIGLIIPLAIVFGIMMALGILNDFIQMTVFSGSKGSIADMLFRWILDLPSGYSTGRYSDALVLSILIIVTLFVYLLYRQLPIKYTVKESLEIKIQYVLIGFAIILSLAAYLFVDYSKLISGLNFNTTKFVFIIITTAMICLLVTTLTRYHKTRTLDSKEVPLLIFMILLFGTAWGCGTSGGLGVNETALFYGLIAALILFLINLAREKYQAPMKTVAIVFLLLFIAISASVKAVHPYEWWGLNESSYDNMDQTTDIPYYTGIHMSLEEKNAYEDFIQKTSLYLGEDDVLYCYNQVMVFYALAHKTPTVRAPIPWFDVARDETLHEDAVYLKTNEPKMIMFCDHGLYPIEAHEAAFNGKGYEGHWELYNWMRYCAFDAGSNYTIISTYQLNNEPMYLLLHI